ncbi:hypothetical protein [Nocardia brasiliensis]|nr:hypothetical protein [Nocardia brasiliensis]
MSRAVVIGGKEDRRARILPSSGVRRSGRAADAARPLAATEFR